MGYGFGCGANRASGKSIFCFVELELLEDLALEVDALGNLVALVADHERRRALILQREGNRTVAPADLE